MQQTLQSDSSQVAWLLVQVYLLIISAGISITFASVQTAKLVEESHVSYLVSFCQQCRIVAPSFSFSLSHSLSLFHSDTLCGNFGPLQVRHFTWLWGVTVHYLPYLVCCLYIGGFTIIYPICITVFWRRAHQITVLVWKSTPDNAPAISYHFVIDIRHRVPPNRPYSYSNSHHSSLLAFEAFNDFQVQLFVAEH